MIINLSLLKKLIKYPEDIVSLTNEKICEIAEVKQTPYKKINNLVTGKVLTCEDHPNSDHLHITTVDIKSEVLQIVCGAPNVKAGQYVIVATEGAKLAEDFIIKPVKLRGIDSNGMICALDEIGLDDLNFTKETGIFTFPTAVPLGEDIYQVLELDNMLIELEPTSNRADLFSYLGYAKDLAAAANSKLKPINFDYKIANIKNPYSLSCEASEVQFYEARYFDSLIIKASPLWMQIILKLNGIDPINNVVDITNYIMLKYGTPLHAFDTNLISDNKLVIRYSKNNEQAITLDQTKLSLTSKEVVISDLEKGLALAGIIGFDNARINANTSSILLESAIFDKTYVQNISKKLNIATDASRLYQKGVSKEHLLLAINEAIFLLEKYANARLSKQVLKAKAKYPANKKIKLSLFELNNLLGSKYDTKVVAKIFSQLNFPYTLKDDNFMVEIPDYRPDIVIKEQLINDFARIMGLNNLVIKGIDNPTTPKELPENIIINKLTEKLANLGLYETKTYSLVNNEETKEQLVLLEGLKSGRKFMRYNLYPSLIDVYNYNVNHNLVKANFFEISDIYLKDFSTTKLSILLASPLNKISWLNPKQKELNFFTIKGVLDYITSLFNLEYQINKTSNPLFHPNYQGAIVINNTNVGIIASILENNEQIYILELDLSYLIKHKLANPEYKEFSKFPQIKRDIAMEIKKEFKYTEIKETIIEAAGSLLKDIKIFDVYDKLANKDFYSLAISLYFESIDETLNGDMINNLVTKIKMVLTAKFHTSYR